MNMDDNLSLFREETIYSGTNNKYPVFIVLTYSDNPIGIAIRKFTGAEWSHCLIAFNPELDPMYSFATRTQLSNEKLSKMGFVYQNSKDNFYALKKSKYVVYVMFVNKAAITAMKNRCQYFMNHEKESKYDFKGLIDIFRGKDTESHRKYFCSRFVAEILAQGVKLDKLPSLYQPEDFKNFNNISLVNAGNDLYFYNPNVTKKNLEYIKHKKYIKVEPQGEQIFYNNRIIGEGSDNTMNEFNERIIFKEYARGIIDKNHYDMLIESLSTPATPIEIRVNSSKLNDDFIGKKFIELKDDATVLVK